ncbi:GGDEF domain-containing phosphodiesterase [Sphingomonas sp. RHCKR7]|uniref:GGDEF domain-containing phosphodiesterase n=1 Tax=Sphingomonas folli TaxID=2862497 RepID=UPI001C676728|nr:GGDEF domain-containing phosphodiesterase [Sphingomonas folli]MBW6526651.1 GGDEF domain-containing phosphodiesterase [Sphingomonas folli]
MERRSRAMQRGGRRPGESAASAEQLRLVEAHAARGVTAIVAAPTSFEIVNTAYGRAAGDQLVEAMAERLAAELAGYEMAAVRGGATFTIVVAGDAATGDAAVSRIERALEQPFAIEGETIHVGARIGVARMTEDEPAEHLLRRAAEALARARASDGATTRVAAEHEGVPLAALAADLHRAIERGEIDVRFQPQVRLADGAVTGVEALARWQHPRLGVLGAETLLAAAHRADLGVALSDQVQALALERAARWPARMGGLRIAVNVTAADMARAPFVERFLARVRASGVGFERVTAEVTETGLIDDLDGAAVSLTALRAAGCRVALDDFGTGYSSLSYLTRLPLDYLKIDRSLVQTITGDARDRVVVEGVIAIAAGLGLETVAEGVESEDERALLAQRGCTFYQGFLWAGPLDDAALQARLAA